MYEEVVHWETSVARGILRVSTVEDRNGVALHIRRWANKSGELCPTSDGIVLRVEHDPERFVRAVENAVRQMVATPA